MLESRHGDLVGFNLLGLALYFQLAVVGVLAGWFLLRGVAGRGLRAYQAALVTSGLLFIWPMSYFQAEWWKLAFAPILALIVGILPAAAFGSAGMRRTAAVGAIVAGVGSCGLLVFNDYFF